MFRRVRTPVVFRGVLGRFQRDEHGGMIIFTLFILVAMLLAIGMAIDTVRSEFARIKLQNVTDSAILAAADLDQTLDPKTVVEDYLTRAGIDKDQVTVTVSGGLDSRKVTATSNLKVKTMFMDMVGIKSLSVPASGTAQESVREIEIVLVLDNSGSMSNNSNYRLNLLKPAAKNFIDQVLNNENSDGKVAVSIVPFATQVTAGETLLSHFNVSEEHSSSHCVTFDDEDFTRAALTTTEELDRTAHFDPDQTRMPPRNASRVCRTDSSREITPWSDNADFLKGRIESMVGSGWTSIEIGTKWGAALLDPASRSVLNAMADSGDVDEKFRGQPFDYGVVDENGVSRMKYLIVMSDGENTNQWDVKDPYREGLSPLYVHVDGAGNTYFSLEDVDLVAALDVAKPFFRFDDFNGEGSMGWFQYPAGDSASSQNARQLTWPEVWEMMSVKYYTKNYYNVALGLGETAEYNRIVQKFASGIKNTRTSAICKAAKDAGVIVYTIGMDTYGQGDTTLDDCSSGAGYFYDVESDDLYQAFESIARSINQLRLTN